MFLNADKSKLMSPGPTNWFLPAFPNKFIQVFGITAATLPPRAGIRLQKKRAPPGAEATQL